MSMDYSPELLRQHAAHKEIRARLFTVKPVDPVVRYQHTATTVVDNAASIEKKWRDWFEQSHLALANEPIKVELSVSMICLEVRKQFGVEKMDFLSARRNQKFVVPRQVAMALCKHLTRKSLPEIGRRMGGRDHTTILHGCRKLKPVMDAVSARLEPDASIHDWVAAMKEQVVVTPFARDSRRVRIADR